MKAKVHVTLKRGVLDPQGKAIGHALQSLGFNGVDEVRQGKFIELDLAETDRDSAQKAVEFHVPEAARQHRDRGLPHRTGGLIR